MSTSYFNVHNSHATLSDFTPTTNDEAQHLLSRMNKTTCKLDPFCTSIIMQHASYYIYVYVHIINLSLSSGTPYMIQISSSETLDKEANSRLRSSQKLSPNF